MNAHRRATRLNKTNEERNASQREARQNLSSKERHEMTARRREASKNKPVEQRQETNARRRARRQSIPPQKRQALRAKRNADLFARRKTPCAESIAMPCSDNQRDWCTGSNGDLPFVIHNKARYLGHCYLLLEVGMNHERGSSELKKTSMCGCLIMGNIPC